MDQTLNDISLVHNQSCPNLMTTASGPTSPISDARSHNFPFLRQKREAFTGDELNSILFNGSPLRTPRTPHSRGNNSFFDSSFSSSLQAADSSCCSQMMMNSSQLYKGIAKCMVTFDFHTKKILTANNAACQLLRIDDVTGHDFQSFFRQPLIEDDVTVSMATSNTRARIMEIVTGSDGSDVTIPVSMWLKFSMTSSKEDGEELMRCIAIFQQIPHIVTKFVISPKGEIYQFDNFFETIFGKVPDCDQEKIDNFIPKIDIPQQQDKDSDDDDEIEQLVCGVSEQNDEENKFPIRLKMVRNLAGGYCCEATLYTRISGAVSVDSNGNIDNLNSNFATLLLGHSKQDLQNQPITHLIPDLSSSHLQQIVTSSFDSDFDAKLVISESPGSPLMTSSVASRATSTPTVDKLKPRHLQGKGETTTTTITSLHIRHKDLSLLPVEVEQIENRISSTPIIWIHYDFMKYQLRNTEDNNLSTINTSYRSPLKPIKFDSADDDTSNCSSSSETDSTDTAKIKEKSSQEEEEEEEVIEGEVLQHYSFDRKLGNGAFGFVYLAHHNITKKKVAVKFISKKKLALESLGEDSIPLEIIFLSKLRHPNIIRALEYFTSDAHFSYVMLLHGEGGIDLFEFIDRHDGCDEMLASYIFRQICSAVRYLHRQNIVHRDIKDENILIDEKFHCKLIDFGSACYFEEGQTFSKFCGTLEYCAPEILDGISYSGEEAEMWALGVTLYTLVCGENPFEEADEITAAKIVYSRTVSQDLKSLLGFLLERNPSKRAQIDDVMMHSWMNMFIDLNKYLPQPLSTRLIDNNEANDENDPRVISEDDDDVMKPPFDDVSSKLSMTSSDIDDVTSPLSRQLENLKF